MKIYNVLWEDEQSNTTTTPFFDKREAIAYAREQAKKGDPDRFFYQEEDFPGSLFFVKYSFGGACLWVTEHEVEDIPFKPEGCTCANYPMMEYSCPVCGDYLRDRR